MLVGTHVTGGMGSHCNVLVQNALEFEPFSAKPTSRHRHVQSMICVRHACHLVQNKALPPPFLALVFSTHGGNLVSRLGPSSGGAHPVLGVQEPQLVDTST